jgi:hypothetical protein
MMNIVKLPPVHTPPPIPRIPQVPRIPPIVHVGGAAIPAALPILGVALLVCGLVASCLAGGDNY